MKNTLKRHTTKSPCCDVKFHWQIFCGMRIRKEVIPEKPKRAFNAYTAKCPSCNTYYEVKV